MTKPKLILVERKSGRDSESYLAPLSRHFEVICVSSGKQALEQSTPDAIVLNALSLHSPGARIARQLKVGMPGVPLVHLLSRSGEESLAESPADAVFCPPFTSRKLISAIKRLLRPVEGEVASDSLLRCGHVTMNLSRRVLVIDGHETALTPKLAALVEAFLRHPGETLDRRWLMKQVWNTDYIEDTRTLDVHVRWFRRVIEPNPNQPCYLKTVRGVGYRLELGSPPPDDEQITEPAFAALEI
jgi:DNA-binding response OmpR family regulator